MTDLGSVGSQKRLPTVRVARVLEHRRGIEAALLIGRTQLFRESEWTSRRHSLVTLSGVRNRFIGEAHLLIRLSG